MRLDQLIYIKEIERQQSMSKAARELFVSQPSLSVALNNLEQEIGVPIFIRGKQGMTPTLMGQIVLERSAVILELAEELMAVNKLSEQEVEGKLKVLMPFFSSSDAGYYLITYFREKYPKLDLELAESDVFKSIQKLAQAQADAAIVDFWAIDEERIRKAAEEANLLYGKVAEDELCLFAAKGHPLTEITCVHLEDLASYPIYSKRRRLEEYFDGCLPEGLEEGDVFEDGEHLKKALIKRPNSVAIMPKRAVADDIYIQTGSIVALNVEERLRRKIVIASLVGQRDRWAPMEGVIYRELCGCIKRYFNQTE